MTLNEPGECDQLQQERAIYNISAHRKMSQILNVSDTDSTAAILTVLHEINDNIPKTNENERNVSIEIENIIQKIRNLELKK